MWLLLLLLPFLLPVPRVLAVFNDLLLGFAYLSSFVPSRKFSIPYDPPPSSLKCFAQTYTILNYLLRFLLRIILP